MDRMAIKSPASRLFIPLFIRAQIKETSKLRVTGLSAGNSLGTGEFPAQIASNAEHVSIWLRHHVDYFPKQARSKCFPFACKTRDYYLT